MRHARRHALTLIVFVSISVTALGLTRQFSPDVSLTSGAFVMGTLLAIFYRMINPTGWVLVLRSLGHPVRTVATTRVWLYAESRRWLPGGVWGYASRAKQSPQLGVPVVVASMSMMIELLLTIAAAVFVSGLGLALYYDELSAIVHQHANLLDPKLAYLATAVVFLIALLPVLIGAMKRWKSRKRRNSQSKTAQFRLAKSARRCQKGSLARSTTSVVDWSFLNRIRDECRLLRSCDVSRRGLLVAFVYFLVMASLNGLINQSLAKAVSDELLVPLAVMIAATATAWVIGFLAFFSPGGILVREAVLATLLLPWMPYQEGIALAVLARFAQIIAEVVCMILLGMSFRPSIANERTLSHSASQ